MRGLEAEAAVEAEITTPIDVSPSDNDWTFRCCMTG